MKRILTFLDKPWALILLFLGPAVLKWSITGQLGVNFQFYFTFAWLPILSVIYSMRYGVKMVLASIFIYAAAVGLLYWNYPSNPPMNFQRQMIFEGTPTMAIAFAMTFVGQIAFKMARSA